MYRILLGLIFVIVIVRIIRMSNSEGWNIRWWKRTLNQRISQYYKQLILSMYKGQFYKNLRHFFLAVSILSFIILAITGMFPVVFFNEHISGLLLIIHVTVAPFFVVAIMLTALFWVKFMQFDNTDLSLIKLTLDKREDQRPPYHKQIFWQKIFFWLFLAFSIPASLSMIFSMFPIFGTDGQSMMLNIHQYTALALLIIVLLYADFDMLSTGNSNNKKG